MFLGGQRALRAPSGNRGGWRGPRFSAGSYRGCAHFGSQGSGAKVGIRIPAVTKGRRGGSGGGGIWGWAAWAQQAVGERWPGIHCCPLCGVVTHVLHHCVPLRCRSCGSPVGAGPFWGHGGSVCCRPPPARRVLPAASPSARCWWPTGVSGGFRVPFCPLLRPSVVPWAPSRHLLGPFSLPPPCWAIVAPAPGPLSPSPSHAGWPSSIPVSPTPHPGPTWAFSPSSPCPHPMQDVPVPSPSPCPMQDIPDLSPSMGPCIPTPYGMSQFRPHVPILGRTSQICPHACVPMSPSHAGHPRPVSISLSPCPHPMQDVPVPSPSPCPHQGHPELSPYGISQDCPHDPVPTSPPHMGCPITVPISLSQSGHPRPVPISLSL